VLTDPYVEKLGGHEKSEKVQQRGYCGFNCCFLDLVIRCMSVMHSPADDGDAQKSI